MTGNQLSDEAVEQKAIVYSGDNLSIYTTLVTVYNA